MSGKDWGQKLLAILVVLAMLAMLGIPPTVLVFFSVIIYFVWRAVDRSEQHETRRVFEFYLAAHEILRDDERRWYGFELSEVVSQGEAVLHAMKDPPPLVYYALGALYQRAGDYDAAVEHLAYVVENGSSDERQRNDPSPELRRYVSVLRRLERDPAEGPQTIAAVQGLERDRRANAASLLADSRAGLGAAPAPRAVADESRARSRPAPLDLGSLRTQRPDDAAAAAPPPAAPAVPPPIAEVLRDLYEEDKKTA
jgi:hypothetical protein